MDNLEIIINFLDNKVYISDEAFVFTKDVLPPLFCIAKNPISWKVKILKYKESENLIFVKVLSYHHENQDFTISQFNYFKILSTVKKITFDKLNTDKLLFAFTSETRMMNLSDTHSEFQQEVKIEEDNFIVPITDVNFKLGRITFHRSWKRFKGLIEFEVHNEELIEEFDSVKDYFSNILGIKKIQVNCRIQIKNNIIIEKEAYSADIEKIGKDLIIQVRHNFVETLFKKRDNMVFDNELLTMDKLINIDEGKLIKSETFYNKEEEFLEDLIKISNSKHYNQLRYLSSKHLYKKMKLRFILKPFSVLFLVEGLTNYHLIWETLNTKEASYVWRVDKKIGELKKVEMEIKVQRIESIISNIKKEGRNPYLDEKEDGFSRIFHDYLQHEEGFTKWKNDIENLFDLIK